MATRFVQQAQQQLNPVYNQQIQGLQSQIPAIQNLYNTLSQSLSQQNQMQLDTGVQNINEDASARGVLRSTLPVDSRQALTAELGAALNTSLGNLGLQQADRISGIQNQIGGLRVDRANAVTSLANQLQSMDQAERQFQMEQQLARQAAALKTSGGGAKPTLTKNKQGGWEVSGGLDLAGYARATGADLITLLLQGDKQDRQAANWYLEKINKYGSENADKYFQELQRDRPTAFYRGG